MASQSTVKDISIVSVEIQHVKLLEGCSSRGTLQTGKETSYPPFLVVTHQSSAGYRVLNRMDLDPGCGVDDLLNNTAPCKRVTAMTVMTKISDHSRFRGVTNFCRTQLDICYPLVQEAG
uniref:Uncharacterized protein n=1 Tax=Physcomitrium patens TaxID=3218 RepID=A0A2K1L2L5_PHYPA|nr:hypothetical protein PHYPA_003058 [Physcomitrium patens]